MVALSFETCSELRVAQISIMIFCLSVIYISFVILRIESKDIFLEKESAFDNLILDEKSYGLHTDVSNVPSIIKCATFCLQYPLCKSIFYNKGSKVCSIHGEKYSTQDITHSSPSPDSVYLNVIDLPPTEIPQTGIVQTCKKLKSCNPQHIDGEYWLYPEGNFYNRTKIYCYDMAGTEPKEYITLLDKDDNESLMNGSMLISTNPCKWLLGDIKQGFFRKIRINPSNMEVNRQDVTFADVIISQPEQMSFIDMQYAFGLGCSKSFTTGGCPLLGYFKIDTRGTGLVVAPSVVFGTGGEKHVPMQLEYSQDNHVITARCDGFCGSCFPSTPYNYQ